MWEADHRRAEFIFYFIYYEIRTQGTILKMCKKYTVAPLLKSNISKVSVTNKQPRLSTLL